VSDAVPAPDRSRVYRTEVTEEATILEELDPASGDVVGSTSLAGTLEIRAVSPYGGAVALMAPQTRSADLYVPEPREYTSINVVWDDDREARNYTLKGNFEPETFSTDEGTLFLIEFFPPETPDRYYVRQLALDSGEVAPVAATEVELNPEMRGHARAQVMAPDGRYLYSLYTMGAGEEPVHIADAGGDSARWAFVHALNLKDKWSYCIFLPLPFGTGPESSISMAISGDGKDLYVVDSINDHIAEIDAHHVVELEPKVDAPSLLDARAERPFEKSHRLPAINAARPAYTRAGAIHNPANATTKPPRPAQNGISLP